MKLLQTNMTNDTAKMVAIEVGGEKLKEVSALFKMANLNTDEVNILVEKFIHNL
jgi:hypothetical protein